VDDSSILAGADYIINEGLGLKNKPYKYKDKQCSQGKAIDFDANVLIKKIYDRILLNWHGGKSRSNENWRWKPNINLDEKNRSREVFLERLIIDTQKGNDWVNQVPVASGLTSSAGGRRAIDLVHRAKDGWYELIELKVDHRGGTPLFAAMEILQYGVLYIFSRVNSKKLEYSKQKILEAKGIHLRVLAPSRYYEGYDFDWLEKCIDRGFVGFRSELKYSFQIDFKFECLSTISRSPIVWGGTKKADAE
jgi:hypothetical protein